MKEHSINKKPNQPLGCVLPFFLLAFIVTACSLYFGHVLYKMHQSKSWITTEATIIDSNLNIESRKGRNTYRAKAYYTYEIDGVSYENNRVTFFDLGGDNVGSSQLISKKLSTASKVLVYVNPKNHKESTIITGLTNSFIFPVWILSILCFLTFCYYRSLYKKSISFKKLCMGLFFFWCSGMVLFYTNIFKIDIEKKITVREERVIVENKPPLKMIKNDVQRGVDKKQFEDYRGPKEISEIQILNNKSMFGNKKNPYIVDIQFSYFNNEVKKVFKGTIIYQIKKSDWIADFK